MHVVVVPAEVVAYLMNHRFVYLRDRLIVCGKTALVRPFEDLNQIGSFAFA